jgi:hypothetical protein
MSADAILQNAYVEWRRLAEAEGNAIRSGNWSAVADCQNALERLQSRILICANDARQEWIRSGADRSAKEESLCATIHELIQLERRNSAILDLARLTTGTQLEELSEARRVLRRVQRSYSPKPEAAWTSFS